MQVSEKIEKMRREKKSHLSESSLSKTQHVDLASDHSRDFPQLPQFRHLPHRPLRAWWVGDSTLHNTTKTKTTSKELHTTTKHKKKQDKKKKATPRKKKKGNQQGKSLVSFSSTKKKERNDRREKNNTEDVQEIRRMYSSSLHLQQHLTVLWLCERVECRAVRKREKKDQENT